MATMNSEVMLSFVEFCKQCAPSLKWISLFQDLPDLFSPAIQRRDALLWVDPLFVYLGFKGAPFTQKQHALRAAIQNKIPFFKEVMSDMVGKTVYNVGDHTFHIVNPVSKDRTPKAYSGIPTAVLMTPRDFQVLAASVKTPKGAEIVGGLVDVYNAVCAYIEYQKNWQHNKDSKKICSLETDLHHSQRLAADMPLCKARQEMLRIIAVPPKSFIPIRRQGRSGKKHTTKLLSSFPKSFLLQGVTEHPNSVYNWLEVCNRAKEQGLISRVKLVGRDKKTVMGFECADDFGYVPLSEMLRDANKFRHLEMHNHRIEEYFVPEEEVLSVLHYK